MTAAPEEFAGLLKANEQREAGSRQAVNDALERWEHLTNQEADLAKELQRAMSAERDVHNRYQQWPWN
jgi:hypothetical protein